MRKHTPIEQPVLHAPPPPSPYEMDRERERREAAAKPKPERGAEWLDFYV